MKADPKVLLLRFSSLGDAVLATAAASYLRARRPSATVVVVTKAAFAPLLQGHPAIDEVLALEQSGGLGALAGALRRQGVTAVLDLHANMRSRACWACWPARRSPAGRAWGA